jgi:F0F1-type ATP synthase membrane subunit c/vacuolar-type H+-ATPase subunit K
MMLTLTATALVIFLAGFASGYGVRAMVSQHHRAVARRHRF